MLMSFALLAVGVVAEPGIHQADVSQGRRLVLVQDTAEAPQPLTRNDPSNWDKFAGRTHSGELLAGAGGVLAVQLLELPAWLLAFGSQNTAVILGTAIALTAVNIGLVPLVAVWLSSLIDTGFYKAGTFTRAYLFSLLANAIGGVLAVVALSLGLWYGVIFYFGAAFGASYGWHSGSPYKDPTLPVQPSRSPQLAPPMIWVPLLNVDLA